MSEDPRYSYVDLPDTAPASKKLDELMDWLMKDTGSGWMAWLGILLKVSVISIWLFTRERAAEIQARRTKQKQEQDRQNHNQDVVDGAMPAENPHGAA